jgi:hypothetical protein
MNQRGRVWELAVALLNGRDDAAVAKRLRHDAVSNPKLWSDLISIANEHLVTAPVWSALQRCGLAATAPMNAAEYLQSFHTFNSDRNRAIQTQLTECVERLNGSGIEPMLLKGAAHLAAGLYGQVGDRYLSDVDLLVRADGIERAFELMLELGYRPASAKDYSKHHHLAPLIREGSPVALELHRAPVPSHAQQASPIPALWENSTVMSAAGARFRLPSPTDAAMLAFLHSAVIDRDLALLLIPLRLFYDAHLLQMRHGASIDWNANFDRAGRIGAAPSLRRYLHVLAKTFGGEPTTASRGSPSDVIHYSLCVAAVRWPAIARLALRAEYFSARNAKRNTA